MFFFFHNERPLNLEKSLNHPSTRSRCECQQLPQFQWIGALAHVQWKVDFSPFSGANINSASWKVASWSIWESYSGRKTNVRRPLVQLCTFKPVNGWKWPGQLHLKVLRSLSDFTMCTLCKKSSCRKTKTALNDSTRDSLSIVGILKNTHVMTDNNPWTSDRGASPGR